MISWMISSEIIHVMLIIHYSNDDSFHDPHYSMLIMIPLFSLVETSISGIWTRPPAPLGETMADGRDGENLID